MANTNRDTLKTTFQNGYVPNQDDFGNVFDSFLNFLKDGVTVTGNLTADKKIGIGNSAPTARLGLAPLAGDAYKSVISLHPNMGDTNNSWTINLNPRAVPGENGFSIGLGSGGNDNRLYIDGNTGANDGRVGLGTTEPAKKLHIIGHLDDGTEGLVVQNERASITNRGWLLGHTDDVSAQATTTKGRLSISEQAVNGSFVERLIVLPTTGNVGIGVSNPLQKLEVNGAIKLGASSGTASAGTIRYSNQTNAGKYELEVFNGTNWIPLIPAAGGGGTVTSVNGVGPAVDGSVALTTDNISQGSTNKYFSNTLVQNVSFSGFPGPATPLADGETLVTAILKLNGNLLDRAYMMDTSRVGSDLVFDRDAEYGSETAPVSDPSISMADPSDPRHKRGVTVLMIHNSGSEPTFGNGTVFKKLEGSRPYVPSKNNYIFLNYRSSTLVTYTITQVQE